MDIPLQGPHLTFQGQQLTSWRVTAPSPKALSTSPVTNPTHSADSGPVTTLPGKTNGEHYLPRLASRLTNRSDHISVFHSKCPGRGLSLASQPEAGARATLSRDSQPGRLLALQLTGGSPQSVYRVRHAPLTTAKGSHTQSVLPWFCILRPALGNVAGQKAALDAGKL